MKKNLSIILSFVALVGVIVLAVVMVCLNVSLSNISLDTFIGVMVTMIGILVTFAVGWQIINALEIKSKLAEIEKIKDDIREQREQMQELAESTKHESMLVRAQEFYRCGDYIHATLCAMESLLHCLPLKVPSNINLVLQSVEAFASFIKTPITAEDNEELLKIDQSIRESNNYVFIQVRYEQICDKYFKFRIVLPKQNKDISSEKSNHSK